MKGIVPESFGVGAGLAKHETELSDALEQSQCHL